MQRVWLLLLLAVTGVAISLALYWGTVIPLGLKGEWTWERFSATPDLTANLILGAVAGLVYVGYVCIGFQRLNLPSLRRRESCGWMLGLAALSVIWITLAIGTGTSGASISRFPFVLYYPSTSGYFYKARYQEPDARQLLRNYEALMREGDVLHVGTHPPGLFLLFHGLIGFVETFPACVPWINSTQPEAVREAFDVLAENLQTQPVHASMKPLFSAQDRAVLWLAALLALAMAAATVIPIYGFVRHYADRGTSWLCAATWPLVPAVAVFLPKSDVAYACLAMTIGALWIVAWRKKSIWFGGLAGGLWFASLMCSLAFLPVALWLALLSLGEAWPAIREHRAKQELLRAITPVTAAASVVTILFTMICLWGDIPLWKTFWLNYKNHAGFYTQYPRSYWGWLIVNPGELALAIGVPACLWSLAGMCRALTSARTAQNSFFAPCLATLLTWTWLWISGKNSGEAARLWIFLMPCFLCCCGAYWTMLSERMTEQTRLRLIAIWFACQLAFCLLSSQRVSGFHAFV